jgi:cytochrome c biogenesis protein CcmG, thiol:disulfide interchange protein DsbE
MSNGRQWLVIGGIVAALGAALFVASRTIGAELFPLRIGSRAPDFSAAALATPAATPGEDATAARTRSKGMDDYRGEVVLLNIWATWCGPCRIEMPSMQRLEERLGPKGLRIVAVSIDDPGMEGRIRAFAEELGLSFELLYDPSGRIRDQYQTSGVPETFVIGRDGRIRRRVIGADDWSSEPNVAFLERLLAEPAG